MNFHLKTELTKHEILEKKPAFSFKISSTIDFNIEWLTVFVHKLKLVISPHRVYNLLYSYCLFISVHCATT